MVRILLPKHLLRHVTAGAECDVAGSTVAEVLEDLNRRYPGVLDYVVDDHGALRKHVNIFIGNRPVRDRQALSDAVDVDSEVYIMQALSGG